MNVSISRLAHVLSIVVFIVAVAGGSIANWNLVPLGLALYVGGGLLEDLLAGED